MIDISEHLIFARNSHTQSLVLGDVRVYFKLISLKFWWNDPPRSWKCLELFCPRHTTEGSFEVLVFFYYEIYCVNFIWFCEIFSLLNENRIWPFVFNKMKNKHGDTLLFKCKLKQLFKLVQFSHGICNNLPKPFILITLSLFVV